MKGLAIKEKLAAERTASDAEALETGKTPERQTVLSHSPPPIHQKTSPPHQQVLLPPVNTANMGRRLSLANGEAAKIDTWVAKRMAADAGQGRPSGHVSPVRSPLMGQAAAARRNSIPYPSPIPEGQQLRPANGMSPKISPSIRPMPSVLHLTAIRNNSRRASMPGAAQLISSGPFTPPRVSSGMYPMGIGRPNRRLTPIKDHDGEAHSQSGLVFGDADLSTTYLTPPSSTYRPSNTSPTSYLPPDSGSMMYDYPLDPSQQSPFTPNAPLPNPTFSFGSGAMQRHSISFKEDQSPYMAMRQRARIGSMASITASTTDGGMENGSDFGQDWMGPSGMDRFDPDARRASA